MYSALGWAAACLAAVAATAMYVGGQGGTVAHRDALLAGKLSVNNYVAGCPCGAAPRGAGAGAHGRRRRSPHKKPSEGNLSCDLIFHATILAKQQHILLLRTPFVVTSSISSCGNTKCTLHTVVDKPYPDCHTTITWHIKSSSVSISITRARQRAPASYSLAPAPAFSRR